MARKDLNIRGDWRVNNWPLIIRGWLKWLKNDVFIAISHRL